MPQLRNSSRGSRRAAQYSHWLVSSPPLRESYPGDPSVIESPRAATTSLSSRSAPRTQLDGEVAVEGVGDSQQRVDPRRPSPTLEPGDRRLRRTDELRELPLREADLLPALGDVLRDRGEEPAPVGGANPLLESLQSALFAATARRHRCSYSGNAMPPARRAVRSAAGRRSRRRVEPRRRRGRRAPAAPS